MNDSSRLYFQEDALAVKDVEEEPTYGDVGGIGEKGLCGLGQQMNEAAEEFI